MAAGEDADQKPVEKRLLTDQRDMDRPAQCRDPFATRRELFFNSL